MIFTTGIVGGICQIYRTEFGRGVSSDQKYLPEPAPDRLELSGTAQHDPGFCRAGCGRGALEDPTCGPRPGKMGGVLGQKSRRMTRTTVPAGHVVCGGTSTRPLAAAREPSECEACMPAERTLPDSSTVTRMK